MREYRKYTWNEILKADPDNKNVFDGMVTSISVVRNAVPFVGAGMSIPPFATWRTSLAMLLFGTEQPHDMIERQMQTDATGMRLNELLNKGLYEEAADYVVQVVTEPLFEQRFNALFSEDKVQRDVISPSVLMIPQLFQFGPAITTNYDICLEKSYEWNSSSFSDVIRPNETDVKSALNHAILGNKRNLFKFHGDIRRQGSRVLTTKEYDKYYKTEFKNLNESDQKNYPFQWMLTRLFCDKVLIFLGCSLDQDRYLDFRRNALHQYDPDKWDYAILAKKSDMSEKDFQEKKQKLAKDNIQVFWYPQEEGDRSHENLYLTLRALFSEITEGVAGIDQVENADRFTYDCNINPISFCGRDQEIEVLREFCREQTPFKWCIITGEGGTGKSRLGMQIRDRKYTEGWITEELKSRNSIDKAYQSYVNSIENGNTEGNLRPILYVIDYLDGCEDLIVDWIKYINSIRTIRKCRMILLDRTNEVKQHDEHEYADLLTMENAEEEAVEDVSLSRWLFNQERNNDSFEDISHSRFDHPCLKLQPLSEDNLKHIMMEYIKDNPQFPQGVTLSEEDADRLFCQLKTIDPGLHRPLYAIFLADVFARKEEGHAEFADRNEVLEKIVRHENRKQHDKYFPKYGHFFEITSRGQRVNDLNRVCDRINVLATLYGSLSVKQIMNPEYQFYAKTIGKIKELTYNQFDDERIANFLKDAWFCQRDGVLSKLNPDLMGEYYLIKYGNHFNDVFDKEGYWSRDLSSLGYIKRLVSDFYPLVKGQILLNGKYGPAVVMRTDWDVNTATAYLSVLSIPIQKEAGKPECRPYVDLLRDEYQYVSSADGVSLEVQELFATAYFKGLRKLTVTEDNIGWIEKEMNDLWKKYPSSVDIARMYALHTAFEAIGAFDDVKKMDATEEKLWQIYQKYKTDQTVVNACGRFLLTVLRKQKKRNAADEKWKNTVNTIADLYLQNPDNEYLKNVYVFSLSLLHSLNLTPPAEQRKSLETLYDVTTIDFKNLSPIRGDEFIYQHELAIFVSKEKARQLIDRIENETLDEAQKAWIDLRNVFDCIDEFQDDNEMIMLLCCGCVILAQKKEEQQECTVEDMFRDLIDQYPNNQMIAERYIDWLKRNIMHFPSEGIASSMTYVNDLQKRFPKSTIIEKTFNQWLAKGYELQIWN